MTIRKMTEQDLPTVADALARSFVSNPVYNYVVEDETARKQFTLDFLTFRLRVGLAYNAAYITSDKNGVAVWLAPGEGVKPDMLGTLGGGVALQAAGPKAIERFQAFAQFSGMKEAELAPMPHYLLSPFGVAPEMQGKGLGGALLRNQLDEFDKIGAVCFLDTQTDENESLYHHFGFETVFKGVIPGTPVPHIAMIRHPQK